MGYSQGRLSHATEHVLKQVPWTPGPLQVAVRDQWRQHARGLGRRLALLLPPYILQLGITPPFQPYLEVQARQTPYAVAYDGYSSVCQPDVVVTGLPEGTVASLDGRRQVVRRRIGNLHRRHSLPADVRSSHLAPARGHPTGASSPGTPTGPGPATRSHRVRERRRGRANRRRPQ